MTEAYRIFFSSEAPRSHAAFFHTLFGHIRVADQVSLIEAIGDCVDIPLSCYRDMLGQLPVDWQKRVAIQSAVGRAMLKVCRRYCHEIVRTVYYEPLPLQTAACVSGLPKDRLVDEVLSALGDSSALFDAERLFTLSGLLAPKLTCTDARECLAYGLDLFDSSLRESDGDGEWCEELSTPDDVEYALAGYVWAALGSPLRPVCVGRRHTLLEGFVGFESFLLLTICSKWLRREMVARS